MTVLKRAFFVLALTALAAGVLLPCVTGECADAPKKIVWKSSGHGPASDPSQIYHDKLCNAITEATGGRLEVKPFVGGSIVPAYKEVDAVNDGVLHIRRLGRPRRPGRPVVVSGGHRRPPSGSSGRSGR